MPKRDPFPGYEGENLVGGGSYNVRQRVSHPKFGMGRILRVHGPES